MSVSTRKPAPYFVAGGTLPPEADSYVERAADSALLSGLTFGKFCYVLNSRQMGKSSLCVRTMKRLQAAGIRTAFVDLTKIGGRNVTAEQWYAGIATEIGRSLELRSEILAYWKENTHLSPVQRLFGALREVVLATLKEPVVVFFDEIDATRSLPFSADEFFAAIRECYNRRVQDPEYKRLRFCLLGVAVPSDLINSPTSTPFNIGERIYLQDFTLEEARPLARGLSKQAFNGEHLLQRIFYWTHGHPYLTQSLCQTVASDPAIESPNHVDALVQRDLLQPKAKETNINLADVGNRAIHAGDLEPDAEKFRANLLSLYQNALNGKRVADDESNRVAALLKLSGIMRSEGGRLIVRNRIYERAFDKAWIRENMPGQERRRQKRAFWVGAIRTAVIATIVIGAMTALALRNAALAREAGQERDQKEYEAYVADVNLMRAAYDSNDLMLLRRLLDQTKNSRYRNVEWAYWNAAQHDAPIERPAYPPGLGAITISPDGKQAAIQDLEENTAEIVSYPDLKRIHSMRNLDKAKALLWAGGAWTIVDTSDRRSYKFYDALSGGLRFSVDVPKLRGGEPDGEFFGGLPSVGGSTFGILWTRKSESVPHNGVVADAKNGRIFASIHSARRINSLDYSDDGKTCALDEVDAEPDPDHYFASRYLVVRDTRTGRILDQMPAKGWIWALRVSSDGSKVAFGINTGATTIRDIVHRRTIATVQTGVLQGLSFSADGKWLFAFNGDLEVFLIEAATGKMHQVGRGTGAVAIAPDGASYASAGAGTRVYPLAQKTPARWVSAELPGTWVRLQGFNASGQLVAYTGHAVRTLDPLTLRQISMWTGASPWLPVSQDGNWIGLTDASWCDVVSTVTGRRSTRLPGIAPYCTQGMDVDSGAKNIARVSRNYASAEVHDFQGKLLWSFKAPAAIGACQWSRSGKYLAVSTVDGTTHLLDGRTGRELRKLTGIKGSIVWIAFSPDDTRLAVGGSDFDLYIFTTATGDAVIGRGHSMGIESLMFTPDGTRVITYSSDGTVRMWDSATGKQVLVIKERPIAVSSAVVGPDGLNLYESTASGSIRRIPLGSPNQVSGGAPR